MTREDAKESSLGVQSWIRPSSIVFSASAYTPSLPKEAVFSKSPRLLPLTQGPFGQPLQLLPRLRPLPSLSQSLNQLPAQSTPTACFPIKAPVLCAKTGFTSTIKTSHVLECQQNVSLTTQLGLAYHVRLGLACSKYGAWGERKTLTPTVSSTASTTTAPVANLPTTNSGASA